ncbi:MAG: AraC family transcriptional regulator, partial [Sphingomonadales bacterium]
MPQTGLTTRSAALTNYIQVSRYLAIDPYELLRQTRISPTLLDDPDNRIAALSVVELFEASAAEADCMNFGLLMAECRDLASLGPVSLLLKHVPTVGDIFKAAAEYRLLVSDILNISLVDDGESAVMRWDFEGEFAKRQIIENAVGAAYKIFTDVVEGRWQPDAVHFRHSAPNDLRHHSRFFACPVEFDSDFDGWASSTASLKVENPRANPGLMRQAGKLLEMLPREPKRSMSDRVRLAIYLLLSSGDLTIEKIADNLALTPRQLQRRLEEEELTFARVLNDTRRELAIRYLRSSKHAIGDVALLLGYSSSSAFTRW